MKIKRITAAIISLAMALTMLAGCGKNDSSSYTQADFYEEFYGNTSEEDEPEPVIVDEPDFMGFLTGASETDFYDMSFEEFKQATGGQFTEENAVDHNDSGALRYTYYLGEMDSMLCGRVKLPKKCEVYCTVRFEKDKLKYMALDIEGVSGEEAKTICDNFITAFEGKLPEGYERFPDSERANVYEVGFTRTWSDFVVSMTRTWDHDDLYDICFSLEIYEERYS